MTQNQIAYQKLMEDKRSHLASETETNRANLARETETNRANLAAEAENLRSHTRNEQIAQGQLDEQIRHQQTVEKETNRSNLARELETRRANMAQEGLKAEEIQSNYDSRVYAADKSAEASAYAADKGYEGRTDTAYINKYGVSKSDVVGAGSALGQAIVNVGKNNPALVKHTGALVVAPAVAAKIAQKQLKQAAVLPVAAGKVLSKQLSGLGKQLLNGLSNNVVKH